MTVIIILAVTGIVLLLAELILPGGIVGIGGAICLLAAVAMTFANHGVYAGMIALVAVLLFGLTALMLWLKYFDRLPFTKSLVLNSTIDDNTEDDRLKSLIGKTGVTSTKVSPSGQAYFDDEKIDVLTEGAGIDKDQKVKIVDTRGPSVFVEEI